MFNFLTEDTPTKFTEDTPTKFVEYNILFFFLLFGVLSLSYFMVSLPSSDANDPRYSLYLLQCW